MKKLSAKVRKCGIGLVSLVLGTAMVLTGTWQSPMSVSAKTRLGDTYTGDYSSLEEQRAAGVDLAIEIASEGMVLLKNKGNTLPLEGVKNVSVFGKRGQDPVYNGSGSGGNSGITPISLYDGLERAGFKVNPTLADMYAGVTSTGNIKTGSSGQSAETIEAPVNTTNYNSDVTGSYSEYSDAAIIVIGRGGGEGGDLKRANVDGHSDKTEHSLELSDDEKALLNHVKSQRKADGSPMFDKIIYLINTAAAFEAAALQDDDEVDAILWIGMPGGNGMAAVGQILNGTVNPSGHLSAIWAANFKQDPTWFNFGNGNQIYGLDHNGDYGDSYSGTPYVSMYGTPNYHGITDETGRSAYRTLDYSEGIYMGYKWYETAATIDGYFNETAPQDAELPYGITDVMPDGVTDTYYNRYNGVLYPFGYGLSYTSFEWEVGEPSITKLAADTEVSISVKVRNTGSVAGKDVVQLYFDPPYTEGGIEKAATNLVNFAKTDTLEPGEEQTLTLTFNARELASFDWNDANENDFSGYELEAGTYGIQLKRNSHEVVAVKNVTVDEGFKYDGSTPALNYNEGYGETSEAVFSQDNEYNTNRDRWMKEGSEGSTSNYVSRSDWKLPDPIKASELEFSDQLLDFMTDESGANATDDKATDLWMKTTADIPDDWTQAADTSGRKDGKTAIQLSEMSGLSFDDPKWTEFMNQLTYQEMVDLLSNSSYQTPALDAAGKPQTIDADGPTQIGDGNTSWPSEPVQAATFNTDIGYRVGRLVGHESISNGTAGWYGPGLNLNRSPFGGRNFEYYSQDGVHAGIYAAAVSKGATEMGVIVYSKHMVLNDQESYRYGAGGISTWLSEQALRELYLRPWEYIIKYGDCNAAMSSYSKIGAVHSTHNYVLNQIVLKDEWGFDGIIVTDMYGSNLTNRWAAGTSGDIAVRNGVTPLGSYQGYKKITGEWDAANNCVVVPESKTISGWVNTVPDKDTNDAVYTTNVTYSDKMVESPTQWYWVRNTAQRMMYVVGNSNAMENLHEYVIEFVPNYAGSGESQVIKVKGGTSFTTPESPLRPGYTFAGWYLDPECTQIATINNAPTSNAVYYADWVPSEGALTISFNENYYGAPEVVEQLVPYGNKVAGYTPVREGYTFVGWYTDPYCTEGNEADLSNPVYQNHTLYAKWKSQSAMVELQFDANYTGNTYNETHKTSVVSGSPLQLTTDLPTRDGYIFAGWTRDTWAGALVPGMVLNSRPVTAGIGNTPMLIKALWLPEGTQTVSVTFNQNYDGAPADSSFKVPAGQKLVGNSVYYAGDNTTYINAVDAAERAGYTFVEWNTAADGSGKTFDPVNDTFSASTTYYAIWQVNQYSVTVNQSYEGAPASTSALVDFGTKLSDVNALSVNPTRHGYSFAGWYSDAACRIVADLNETVSGEMTLYAKWQINTYNVTFDYNCSDLENTVVGYEFNSTPVAPETPVRYGYLFDGWYTDETCTGFAIDLSTQQISADTVYYAKWIANSSTVTFDYNFEGGATHEYVVENGEVPPAIAQPNRAGYTFAGWYLDEACTTAADFNEALYGNVTYYAKWVSDSQSAAETSGGCSSVVASDVAIVAASLAAVAGVVVVTRRKKNR